MPPINNKMHAHVSLIIKTSIELRVVLNNGDPHAASVSSVCRLTLQVGGPVCFFTSPSCNNSMMSIPNEKTSEAGVKRLVSMLTGSVHFTGKTFRFPKVGCGVVVYARGRNWYPAGTRIYIYNIYICVQYIKTLTNEQQKVIKIQLLQQQLHFRAC